jgi:hypothetical protein
MSVQHPPREFPGAGCARVVHMEHAGTVPHATTAWGV